MNETIGEAPRDAVTDARMTAKVLERAAEIVEQGWCQHFLAMVRPATGVSDVNHPDAYAWCALGAIKRAESEIDGDPTPRFGVRNMLAFNAMAVRCGGSIAYWNNAPGRTSDEVATAFRAAAHALEPRDA